MKAKLVVGVSLVLLGMVTFSLQVFGAPVGQEQAYYNIINNCGSIKTRLSRIQINDSFTRVGYGQMYESVIKNVFTPANTRLVANRYDASELVRLTTDFNTNLQQFRSQYQAYKVSMDETIAIDCRNKPAEFYQKLVRARALRTNLQLKIEQLNQQMDDYQAIFDRLVDNE